MRIQKIYCDLCGEDMTDGRCTKIHVPMTDRNNKEPRIRELEICYECGCRIARKIEEYALKGIKE